MEAIKLFPEWASLLRESLAPAEAITAFKEMARRDSQRSDDEGPRLPARNGLSSSGDLIKVRMNLAEPDGDHDHCLYKAANDTTGRACKGKRRPQDFQPERAACIRFVPLVLANPDFIYTDKKEPWVQIYVCRTGPDAYFMVAIHKREKGEPRYSFTTAYPLDGVSLDKKRLRWTRLYPPSKSKKGAR